MIYLNQSIARKMLVILLMSSTLSMGCSATHTAINKRKLDVQTKMSASVFLDPVNTDKKSVYLQARNTSDKVELDLAEPIKAALEAKGYRIVSLPEQAHFVLQSNILQVERSDLRTAEHTLSQGFGAALGGAAAGAAVGSLASSRRDEGKGLVIGGLVGAGVGTITDAMIQDVAYIVVADVQISERVGNSVVVREKTRSNLKQGARGVREVSSTERIDWKRYQTRIVSTANKVNLKFKQAAPDLVYGLTRAITGVF